MKIKKRGQAWGIDLAVALMIFTFGILIFFFYTVNRTSQAGEILDLMYYEGNVVADSLLSEGSPKNWNSSKVNTIGVLSDGKINETKLEYFYNLSSEDYNMTLYLFNTRFDYYFFLSENLSLSSGEVQGIGEAPYDEDNLVQITRFTIYKNKPVTAYLHVWN
jgi:hypothetical protein